MESHFCSLFMRGLLKLSKWCVANGKFFVFDKSKRKAKSPTMKIHTSKTITRMLRALAHANYRKTCSKSNRAKTKRKIFGILKHRYVYVIDFFARCFVCSRNKLTQHRIQKSMIRRPFSRDYSRTIPSVYNNNNRFRNIYRIHIFVCMCLCTPTNNRFIDDGIKT